MPTTRRRITRNAHPEIGEAEWCALTDQELPPGINPLLRIDLEHFSFNSNKMRTLWEQHGESVLEEFTDAHPGQRPACWWHWSSPRATDAQLSAWGKSVEEIARLDSEGERPGTPRQRIGGIGTPSHEVLNITPDFEKGIPMWWVQPWDADYYNGRAIDVRGNKIGNQYHEGDFAGLPIDNKNPPRFESQASFLKRHDLLLPEESVQLTAKDFLPETVQIEIEPARPQFREFATKTIH